MLQAGIDELAHAPVWRAVPEIVFINILLSGDNAVLIAMACRALPPRQRAWGLVIGAGGAVILLIVFAGLIAYLMQFPYLKLAGGLALLYIAAKLLVPDAGDSNEVVAAEQLWHAVRIVLVADLVMSFDNILAVVQIAKGDFTLLAVGLIVSIPVVVAGATLVSGLVDRLPVLVWAGAALLGWVAGQTIIADKALAGFVNGAGTDNLPDAVSWSAGGAGAVLVIAAGGAWRRWRKSKSDRLRRGRPT
jgi:YjbE family integral membrane protein